MARSILLLLALAILVTARPAAAQTSPTPTRDGVLTATLEGWHDRLHFALRDQRHASGSLFFPRGQLRPLTPSMDHEYDLDLLSYGFTLRDDAQFYEQEQAFRSFMGSIDRSHFVTTNHVRIREAVGRHLAAVTLVQRDDLSAQGLLTEVGYGYRFYRTQRLRARLTVSSYKPDLDFSLAYTLGDRIQGGLQVRATLLDVANDFIFETLGVDPTLEDTTRAYEDAPRLWHMAAFSPRLQRGPLRGLRAELVLGVQPSSEARIGSTRRPEETFRWSTRARFAGGLIELPVQHFLTLGLTARHTFTGQEREAVPESPLRTAYESEQAHTSVGGFALAQWQTLHAEMWLRREHRKERQDDPAATTTLGTFDVSERRWTGMLRLQRIPHDRGWRAGLTLLTMARAYGRDGFEAYRGYLRFVGGHLQSPRNQRLQVLGGYQLRPGAYVMLGANLDLDGDTFHNGPPRRYDGALGRLMLTF